MDEQRPSDEDLPPRSSPPPRAPRGHERVPPHSLEAEASVLGACLLSQRAATDVAAILGPDDFYRSAHATLFEGILALRRNGTGIDSITLTEWLRDANRLGEVGGAAAVHELAQSVPTAANAEYYARIVRDKAMLRRLIDVAGRMAELGFEPTDDVQAVLDQAESLVFRLNEQGTVNDYAELKELLDEAYVAIEQRADRDDDVTGLRTGFVDLDRLTAGLQPSNLIIVAARPAMGKSSLALSIARFVSVDQKKPSILFSLEMSRREIVERLLSAQARIDSTRIRVGKLDQTDWTKLADALGDMSDAPLFIDDTPSITMMEIQSKCRQLKHKRGLELVIVDYLQLMQSHRSVDNRQQEVAEISRGLKRLAMDLEVPVVALSQLSRQPEARTDKRPVLSDLRESGSIEQDADLVAFIYRDEVYHEDSEAQGLAELIVAKHRNGPVRTVHLAFLNHLTQFANLARGASPAGRGPAPPPSGPPPEMSPV
ncbi:MAG: replicative DNA helicase [Nitriliruptorales bacterium]|nr:replicative DNA helicase [Nitriliruptorales bacterium]